MATNGNEKTQVSCEDWKLELYKQGSEACRNYSQLTMKTRTLSQQVLVLSLAGFSAVFANKEFSRMEIALIGGFGLLVFAISMFFVDWHYQSAFTAIRNSIAKIESELFLEGPWRAHLRVRTNFKDHIASYFPFLLLFITGWSAIGVAIKLGGWTLWMASIVLIPIISAIFLLYRACSKAAKKDKELSI